MPFKATNVQELLDKIQRLPPERIEGPEDFVHAVVQGLRDIETGRIASLEETKKKLGLV